MRNEIEVERKLGWETPEFSKYLVWTEMHEIIRKIEDGEIDGEKVRSLMWSLKAATGADSGGLQPIYSETWETLDKWNEALGMGFDEMIDEGLAYFERTYESELEQASEQE
jgi:hypothetical protein